MIDETKAMEVLNIKIRETVTALNCMDPERLLKALTTGLCTDDVAMLIAGRQKAEAICWQEVGGCLVFRYKGVTYHMAEPRDYAGKTYDIHVVMYETQNEYGDMTWEMLDGFLYGVPFYGDMVDSKWLSQIDKRLSQIDNI